MNHWRVRRDRESQHNNNNETNQSSVIQRTIPEHQSYPSFTLLAGFKSKQERVLSTASEAFLQQQQQQLTQPLGTRTNKKKIATMCLPGTKYSHMQLLRKQQQKQIQLQTQFSSDDDSVSTASTASCTSSTSIPHRLVTKTLPQQQQEKPRSRAIPRLSIQLRQVDRRTSKVSEYEQQVRDREARIRHLERELKQVRAITSCHYEIALQEKDEKIARLQQFLEAAISTHSAAASARKASPKDGERSPRELKVQELRRKMSRSESRIRTNIGQIIKRLPSEDDVVLVATELPEATLVLDSPKHRKATVLQSLSEEDSVACSLRSELEVARNKLLSMEEAYRQLQAKLLVSAPDSKEEECSESYDDHPIEELFERCEGTGCEDDYSIPQLSPAVWTLFAWATGMYPTFSGTMESAPIFQLATSMQQPYCDLTIHMQSEGKD